MRTRSQAVSTAAGNCSSRSRRNSTGSPRRPEEQTMSLTLYFHPLSSFCQKAVVALYENDTPFTPHLVDLMDPEADAAFKAIWPIGRFPVLRDNAKNQLVPESTMIIEYLDQNYPGKTAFI